MFNAEQIAAYFKAVAKDIKTQVSAAVSFGTGLFLLWYRQGSELKIFITILFIFPICMFFCSIVEKIILASRNQIRIRKSWRDLTPDELAFLSFYVSNNTRTRYVPIYNGTYQDSGIINPLIAKGILYLASQMSEYRGDSWMSAMQHFPINIHDKAFSFFKKNVNLLEKATKN